MKFLKLTPKNDLKISHYEEAINFAIQNDDITNIAITGGYGTGKSSVLNSYIEMLKKNDAYIEGDSVYHSKAFMHINLGSFSNEQESDSENEGKKEVIEKLEEKIISQILHQVEKKKVPQSIFKVKENISFLNTLFDTIMIFFPILLTLYFFLPQNMNIITAIFGKQDGVLKSLIIIIYIISLFCLFYKFMYIQKVRNLFRKIRFYGNELELEENNDFSYFDKYMNDVIYLLLNSDKKIFVFEDLDRFNEPKIYEKLVEINTLLNKRISTKNYRFKFIYLLRDDIFTSKERTKIFDFIIPIVPTVVHGNSYYSFKQLLTEIDIPHEFDNNLLETILIYIDDMRLLKNVLNEYCIYKSEINFEIDNTKLITVIIYKNIFPTDFYNFQYGKSYIDYVLNTRSKLIAEKQIENNVIIKNIKEEIISQEKEAFYKKDQFLALHFNFTKYLDLSINNRKLENFDSNAEFLKLLRESNYVAQYRPNSLYLKTSDINLKDEYERVMNIVETKYKDILDHTKNKLEEKVLRLEKENNELIYLPTSNLLQEKSREYFVKMIDDNQNYQDNFNYLITHEYFDLLIFLLKESLIDRECLDYISSNKDSELTVNDKSFIRKVYDGNKDISDFIVQNPGIVLNKFKQNEIRKRKLLNYSLTDYIINEKLDSSLNEIIEVCMIEDKFAFLSNCYSRTSKERKNYLIERFLIQVPDELKDESLLKVVNCGNFSLITFLNDLSYELKVSILKSKDIRRELSDSNIYSHELYMLTIEENLMVFKEYDIKFNNIHIMPDKVDIIHRIIQEDLININEHNIIELLNLKEKFNANEKKYRANISSIVAGTDEIIYKYLLVDNINKYLNVYEDFNKNSYFDEPNDIQKIMENEDVQPELMLNYLEKYQPSKLFEKIEEVPDIYKQTVLTNLLFTFNTDNLNYIFRNYSDFSVDISEKLELNNDNIDYSALSDDIKEDVIYYVLRSDLIHDKNKILKKINYKIKKIESSDLQDDDYSLLTQNNLVLISDENILSILNTSAKSLSHYTTVQLQTLNFSTIKSILDNATIDLRLRRNIFLENVENFVLEEIFIYIKKLKYNLDLIKILNRIHKEFPKIQENRIILSHYNKMGLLVSYKEKENTIYVSSKKLNKINLYKDIKLEDYLS